ncbi:MAG: cyclase family protein [Actinomycetota bacterium]
METKLDTLEDFRRVADKVRNWGRWGDDDEMGTLNFIDADKIRDAAKLVKKGKAISLGADFGPDGPQQGTSPLRINPLVFLAVDGGDGEQYSDRVKGYKHSRAQSIAEWRADGDLFRFNEDYIVMPLQACTQWDALSHVYYDEKLYNGYPSNAVTSQGATKNSIWTVGKNGGIVSRGVLLDVAHHRGVDYIDGGLLIEPEELDEVAKAQGVEIQRGDVVIVRTGWWHRFYETGVGTDLGTGVSWHIAEWLHDHEVAAVAADNHAVEGFHYRDSEATFLPLHLIAQRDMGLHMGELFELEELSKDCAEDGVYEFQFVAPPLRVVGAVGSPINPIALK